MKIVSLCPFNVATVRWETRAAEWTLTVIVKATFSLRHDREATLAEVQDPLNEDRRWDNNPDASLYAPSDFVPFKPRADILLVGHAHAPNGAPVTELDARLHVGDFSKTVRVVGDHRWVSAEGRWVPGPSAPFTKMPLRYERAARTGDNPVDVGPRAPAPRGASALPNLEALGDPSGPSALGFGPLCPTWRPRRGLVNEAAFLWARGARGDRFMTSAAPVGFDFGFFNAAPRDQQVDLLPAGATIILENMHRDHARFETRLPGVRPKVFLPDPITGRPREVALRGDTLWIDTDREVATVVWRGLTRAGGVCDQDSRRMVVVVEMKGQPTRIASIDRLLHEGAAHEAMTAKEEAAANLLNQRHDAVKPLRRVPGTRSAQQAEGLAEAPGGRLDVTRELVPKQKTEVQSPEPASFGELSTQRIEPPSYAEDLPPLVQRANETQAIAVPERPPTRLPFDRSTLVSARERRPWADSADGARIERDPTVVVVSSEDELSADRTLEIAGRVVAPEATPDDVTVEQYAQVCAELAERPAERPAILAFHAFPESLWLAVDSRWRAAIAKEVAGGQSHVLARYDTAYITAQEGFRHPIGTAEYARILVGLERGEVGPVLRQLKLRLPDLMRLQRVWTKRLAVEAKLASELSAALAAARAD